MSLWSLEPLFAQHQKQTSCLLWVVQATLPFKMFGMGQKVLSYLLTIKLWLIFMGKKQKKIFFWKKKIQNGRLKKSAFFKIANSQNFFVKISWIGSWVSRIDWCEGHWFISTYMAVRLSDIRAKTGKNFNICVFRLFFCFFPMKISQSLLVSKDGSKFWSSQTWQHFLTQTKYFEVEWIRSCSFVLNS